MKYRICVDSSSNLLNNHIIDSDVGFNVVPLTIRVGKEEYVDNDELNVDNLLKEVESSKEACTSSCPSPQDFLNHFEDAEYVICVTISQKLSGCYNSACVARDMSNNKDNILIVDSRLTAGAMRLIVDKAYELIKSGKEFNEIKKELLKYRDSIQLLFVLDKFDNLVKNGRMSKVVAFIAQLAAIKPLCYGEGGEIKIKEKVRTIKGVLKRLVHNIGLMCPVTKGRVCVISHTQNKESALLLKTLIEEEYEFDSIIVEDNRGLCAFYALSGGLLVSF